MPPTRTALRRRWRKHLPRWTRSVLGSRQVHEDDARDYPNAPLLRLRIDTVVGSVKVYRV